MALARKCDRCDGFYLEDNDCHKRPADNGHKIFKVITEGADIGHVLSKYDLCPSCANAFIEFMNNKEVE